MGSLSTSFNMNGVVSIPPHSLLTSFHVNRVVSTPPHSNPMQFNMNRWIQHPSHSFLTQFDTNRVGSIPPHFFHVFRCEWGGFNITSPIFNANGVVSTPPHPFSTQFKTHQICGTGMGSAWVPETWPVPIPVKPIPGYPCRFPNPCYALIHLHCWHLRSQQTDLVYIINILYMVYN